MIDITVWMQNFLQTLNKTFENRVWFVGLQGSYGRGEATETSDIDVVVILDELSAKDIQTYNDMLDTLPHRKLICGFLSGKNEIMNWEPSDLFQFCNDTTPIKGTLDEVVEAFTLLAIGQYDGKVCLLNLDGFYEPLLALLRRYVDEKMMTAETFARLVVASSAEELLSKI